MGIILQNYAIVKGEREYSHRKRTHPQDLEGFFAHVHTPRLVDFDTAKVLRKNQKLSKL